MNTTQNKTIEKKEKKILKEYTDDSDNKPVKYKTIECRKKDCCDEAKYNEKGESKPRYCKKHKKDDYVLISEYFKNDKFCALNLQTNNEVNNKVYNDDGDDNNTNNDNKLINAGKPWKDEDVKKLLNLIEKNKTCFEISELLGRTECSIKCKKESITYELLKTKSIDEVKKMTKFTDNEINEIKKKYEQKYKPKQNKSSIGLVTESINLIDKLNDLANKNMEHFKLTGKTFISDKLMDSLLSDLKK